MLLNRARWCWVGLGVAGAVALAGCREPPPAITISAVQIVVQNQTKQEWSGVEIWLNDHYRVQYPWLRAGQRLVVPLDRFVAGYGQRFDRRRQVPAGIEVTARASDGSEVRLVWGRGRRRW